MKLNTPGRMTEEDLLELDTFIAERSAMKLYEFWGFIVALISHPVVIPPSTWLPLLLDEGEPFEDEAEAQRILGLIMAYWNRCILTLKKNQVILPVLEPEGLWEWCSGYTSAMDLDDSWVEDEIDEEVSPFAVIEFYADAYPRRDRLNPQERKLFEVIDGADLESSALNAYRTFRAAQQEAAGASTARQRVGRNEPCPCGSGVKYKKCCQG